ncbi:MAG: dienelactone hydrolase family protein [Chloroflexi bacterium]|nr:dienelactone hydrolase family protein [Chloroflexota bacterium]MBV9600961.1 dienelactone hydrolase family protein [Chloroflexota bacterium]
MGYEGLIGETITMRGHNGAPIEAYLARPIGVTSAPGVVVIHHMPGWDEWTREVTRKLAEHGYAAIAPHLFSRLGPGAWDDLAAAARSAGGMPDAQVVGDVGAAVALLRDQPLCNGKVGVIGFCSGGRQAYMMACKLDIDAAVDCWGGRVIAKPEELNERQPVAVIDMTTEMRCPLLGIFGNDDASPDPEQVNRTEAVLRDLGKDYEFHRYDGAGHGFFATDRANYRPEQAVDGWKKVFAFFERTLQAEAREPVLTA